MGDYLDLANQAKRTEEERAAGKAAQPEIAHELVVSALKTNLYKVQQFVTSHLENLNCSMKTKMQFDLIVEELFVNISLYAYELKNGEAKIRFGYDEDTDMAAVTFIDSGMPYDPLAKEDPDVTLPSAQRAIGGLGIFMCKKLADEMSYEYKDGQNILTVKKKLHS